MSISTLVDRFRCAGLCKDDSVIVHCAFRSLMAHVTHPNDIIDALLRCIGDRGNLMMPTFNYSAPLPDPCYDPNLTPARTGILAECGRKHSAALRSLHPTHSVAVIGPDAHLLTRDHLLGRAFGVNSPIGRLAQRGGKILLLGVGQTANSTIHVGEECAGILKAARDDPMPSVNVRMESGSIIKHQLDTSPSCSAGFEAVAGILRHKGVIHDARIDHCLIQLMSGYEVITHVVELLKEDPMILFCTDSHCLTCSKTRAIIKNLNH